MPSTPGTVMRRLAVEAWSAHLALGWALFARSFMLRLGVPWASLAWWSYFGTRCSEGVSRRYRLGMI